MPRQNILDNYVFFTAGSCGPCRFGMYESEYRFALKNAGFDGFRVLLFHDSDGLKAASGEPGLKFTVDFGLGMLNALHVGDVMNDLIYQVRPFEVNKGETEQVFQDAMEKLPPPCVTAPRLKLCRARRNGRRVTLRKRKPCATPSTPLGKFVSTFTATSTSML
jgi:predicted nucleotide-binding protein (sugar kinase/HSP70/actin superfamily)